MLSLCERGMDILDSTGLVRLGFPHHAMDTCRWCEFGAATLDIKAPTHIGDSPDEPKNELQEEEKRDEDMEGHEDPPVDEQPQPPAGGTVRHPEGQENNAAAANIKKQRVLKPAGTLRRGWRRLRARGSLQGISYNTAGRHDADHEHDRGDGEGGLRVGHPQHAGIPMRSQEESLKFEMKDCSGMQFWWNELAPWDTLIVIRKQLATIMTRTSTTSSRESS